MKLSKSLSMANMDTAGISQLDNSKWDTAIADAEGEIRELTRKRARLAYAVRVFRANKRDGIPWPGPQRSKKIS